MHRRSRGALVAAWAALTLAVIAWCSGAATAAPVLVPKDASGHVVVEMTATDGAISGTVSLANPNDAAVTVRIAGTGAIARCTFAGATLAPAATVDVKITSARCSLDENGASATMTLSGATTATVQLELKPTTQARATSLGASLVAFLLAAAGSLLLIVLVFWRRPRANAGLARVALGDELGGLPTGWKFQDSWATSVGTVSTLFVGIFGTTDVVKALAGATSDTLPGRLLIVAAVSALLIGLAPLAVKVIGPASQTATVRGLLVGSWLTTTAVCGQILAVYAAFAVDEPVGSAWRDFFGAFTANWALLFAAALIVFLAVYVARTLHVLLTPSVTAPPTPSDTLLAASATLLAAEVCCDPEQERGTASTLLDLAYVRAVNHLAELEAVAHAAATSPHTDLRVAEARRQYADLAEILVAARSARPARSAVL